MSTARILRLIAIATLVTGSLSPSTSAMAQVSALHEVYLGEFDPSNEDDDAKLWRSRSDVIQRFHGTHKQTRPDLQRVASRSTRFGSV